MILLPVVGTVLGLFAAQSDSVRIPRWIAGEGEIRTNSVFESWLVVPAGGSDPVRVRIGSPSEARFWIAPGAQCAGTDTTVVEWSGVLAADTVLVVCGTARESGAIRVVGVVRNAAGAIVASSDAVVARDWWQGGGAAALALVSAFFGFAFGTVTRIIEGVWTRSQERTRNREAIEKKVFELLAPELQHNAIALARIVADTKPPTEQLQVGAYNTILGEGGLKSYLSAKSRRAYFARLESLYEAISAYNKAARNQEPSARELATKARAALTMLTGERP